MLGIDKGLSAATKGFSDKIGKAFSGLSRGISNNLGAAIGIGLVIGTLVALAKLTDEIGEEFGAIGAQEFNSQLVSAKATAVSLGYSFEEVAGSVKAMSNEFGIAFDDAIEISKASMDTARALGISADEAAGLTGMLMTMSGHSAESAQNFLKQGAALAKGVGVPPAAVMADIAENTESVASYSKDSGENIMQAAVNARKMGLNLEQVSSIADGLLDFQTSLQAEMEASVITGKQLNLQRARELALAGDLKGMTDEILQNVVSEAEWNQMNTIERQALADAIGIDVAGMSKMVNEAGKTHEELKAMRDLDISEIVSEDALSQITVLTNNLKSVGLTILSGIAWMTTFGGTMDGIGGTIMSVLVPALLLLGGGFLFFYLKGLMARAMIKGMGKTMMKAGPQMASFGISAGAAIPVLLAIALVGATLVGVFYGIGFILKQLPPIISAIAAGFVIIAQAITQSLLALATKETVLGIMGLAVGFYMLAGALMAVASAGMMAMPAMSMVGGLALIAGVAGLGGFLGARQGKKEKSPEVVTLEETNRLLALLVDEGFLIKGTKANKAIKTEGKADVKVQTI